MKMQKCGSICLLCTSFLEIGFGRLLCFLMISEMNDYILYMLKCRVCRILVLMS